MPSPRSVRLRNRFRHVSTKGSRTIATSIRSRSRRLTTAAFSAALAATAPALAGGSGAPPYTDADYAPYAAGQTGPGKITGAIVLHGPKQAVIGANALVAAFPDEPYTRWYLAKRHDAMNQPGGVLPHQRDDAVISYPTYDDKIIADVRTTTTDAHGRFTFNHVPRGNYIVVGQFATVATGYMPAQAEDTTYGPVNVDDFHAPPPNEFAENDYYLWLVGSKPIAVGSSGVSVGALSVYNGYFCGPLQRCVLVNDFANGGETQGQKLNRALGIGAEHGYQKRQFEPVANPGDGVKSG